MALDLSNPTQVRTFRQQQLAKGRNEQEIDSFLRNKVGELKGTKFDTAMDALSKAQLKKDTTAGEYWAQGPAPNANLLQKMAYGVATPGVKYSNLLLEAFGQPFKKEDVAQYIAPEKYEKVRGDLLQGAILGLQRGAGAAQYAVPAGRGANAFLTGGAQGLLSGIGQTEESANLGNVLLSTALGAGIEGGTQMLPKLLSGKLTSKAGKKLEKAGETAEMKARYQRFGRPLKKEGYGNFFKKLEQVDEFKPLLKNVSKNTDDLLETSNQILSTKGSQIADVADDLTKAGVTTTDNAQEVIDMLDKMKSSARTEERKAIQSVTDSIQEDIKRGLLDNPNEFYTSKISYGKNSSWNTFDSADWKKKANVWGDVYNKMNDIFDKRLKEQGFDQFRSINRDVSTAIRAQSFAERQLGKVPVSPTRLGLRELITGASATAAGGPIAGIGSILGSRMLTKPGSQELLGRALQTAGRGAQGISLAVPQVNPMLSKALGISALNLPQGQQQQVQQTPTGQMQQIPQQAQPQGIGGGMQQITPQMLMMGRATLSNQAYSMLKDMYDLQQEGAGVGGKLTKEQQSRQDVSNLATQTLQQLQTQDIKTGKLRTPVQQLMATLGMADQPTLEFNTNLANIKATIAKARAGTSFTPNEEKLLNRYTPTPGDSKQQLETKLKGLIKLFGSK